MFREHEGCREERRVKSVRVTCRDVDVNQTKRKHVPRTKLQYSAIITNGTPAEVMVIRDEIRMAAEHLKQLPLPVTYSCNAGAGSATSLFTGKILS